MKLSIKGKYPYNFIAHYALIYSLAACYSSFIPLYFSSRGFNKSEIGILLAVGPTIAMMAQPVWGMIGDRAKSKNQIIKIMLAGSSLAILLYLIPAGFFVTMAFVTMFVFFQGSINSMSDTITLEYLETTKWDYGFIRVAGSVGFAITAIIVGIAARQNILNIFIMYAVLAFVTLFRVTKLPVIKGHQSRESRVHIWELKKNPKLIVLLCFNLLVFTTMGFNGNFFSLYYKQMGADMFLIGIYMFVQAITELPFLFYAGKIVKKLGIERTMLLSAAITGIRWLMMHYVVNIYIVPLISVLSGVSYIVIAYCVVTYINQTVPIELRASGQILYNVVSFIGTSIVGSLIGGFLSDMVGIRQMYLYSFYVNIAAVVIFGVIFRLKIKSTDNGYDTIRTDPGKPEVKG